MAVPNIYGMVCCDLIFRIIALVKIIGNCCLPAFSHPFISTVYSCICCLRRQNVYHSNVLLFTFCTGCSQSYLSLSAAGCSQSFLYLKFLLVQISRASLIPESSYISKPAASWLDDFLVWISPEAFGCCRKFTNGSYCPPDDQVIAFIYDMNIWTACYLKLI